MKSNNRTSALLLVLATVTTGTAACAIEDPVAFDEQISGTRQAVTSECYTEDGVRIYTEPGYGCDGILVEDTALNPWYGEIVPLPSHEPTYDTGWYDESDEGGGSGGTGDPYSTSAPPNTDERDRIVKGREQNPPEFNECVQDTIDLIKSNPYCQGPALFLDWMHRNGRIQLPHPDGYVFSALDFLSSSSNWIAKASDLNWTWGFLDIANITWRAELTGPMIYFNPHYTSSDCEKLADSLLGTPSGNPFRDSLIHESLHHLLDAGHWEDEDGQQALDRVWVGGSSERCGSVAPEDYLEYFNMTDDWREDVSVDWLPFPY